MVEPSPAAAGRSATTGRTPSTVVAAMTVITGYDYMTIGLKHMAASQPPKSQPWMASAAMLARKFDLPVIPVNIRARNSVLFYLFDWSGT